MKCYEGAWVPGLWRNPFLKNPLPDIVILLSVKWNERSAVLRELRNLNLPVINFSAESLEWNHLTHQLQEHSQITHFYMQVIRFLLLRFQQNRRRSELVPDLQWAKAPLGPQIGRLVAQFTKSIGTPPEILRRKVCSRRRYISRKSLKKNYIHTNLFSLQGKKRSSWGGGEKPLRIIRSTDRITPLKRLSDSTKKV